MKNAEKCGNIDDFLNFKGQNAAICPGRFTGKQTHYTGKKGSGTNNMRSYWHKHSSLASYLELFLLLT